MSSKNLSKFSAKVLKVKVGKHIVKNSTKIHSLSQLPDFNFATLYYFQATFELFQNFWTQNSKAKVKGKKKQYRSYLQESKALIFLVEIKANVYIGIIFNFDRWAIPAALIDIVP